MNYNDELLTNILRKHNIANPTIDAIVKEFIDGELLTTSVQNEQTTHINKWFDDHDPDINNTDDDDIESSEEYAPNYLDCQESSFASFFSNIDKSPSNCLKKGSFDDGTSEFYLRGYKMPAEAADELGTPSEHLWRIVITGMKKVSDDRYTFYTNAGVPGGNCWYDSLSDNIQCSNWNSYYGEDRYLTSKEVKTTLEQFVDIIPGRIVDNKGTQRNPIWE